jgi:pimeloyl-ACP methyl ester carboxylesterase
MDRLPIIYIRGYAGPTTSIDTEVDDPFYGFNYGSTHVRVGGDGDPVFYQFEGPLLRLIIDEGYQLLVHGDQHQYLLDAADGSVTKASLWMYRFYDQAATTFVPQPHQNLFERLARNLHRRVTADGFDIESAAVGLYELVELIRRKTGAPKVYLVAHSMGGLVARCMMQKICRQEEDTGSGNRPRRPAKDLVAKFFTYGTPHGGIAFQFDALDWAEQAFGPAGSDIFAPEKMYGYLDNTATFGETAPPGSGWDPQDIPEDIFPADDIFCLVGTDPKDYGPSRFVVGPKSDGLVLIEHAYVRRAHRAYIYKSHSSTYGEVNSEEGYQNLRRFLFGRWQVRVEFDGLPTYPTTDEKPWAVWQADMRLAIRGLSIVMSEQLAAHWCPIQLNDEIKRLGDTPDHPVPLVSTFLLDPARRRSTQSPPDGEEVPPQDHEPAHHGRARYTLTLRVFQLDQRGGGFRFNEHLEQVPDWADSLIVDVGPAEDGAGPQTWMAWNSCVAGPNDTFDPITDGLPPNNRHPTPFVKEASAHVCRIFLPPIARALPVLGKDAALKISVRDRETSIG